MITNLWVMFIQIVLHLRLEHLQSLHPSHKPKNTISHTSFNSPKQINTFLRPRLIHNHTRRSPTIMAPIRLAIIGLSSTATTSWASSAHLPYLLSPRGRARYTITALCNSSLAAAKTAIAAFGLDPATTTPYGDAAALAAAPDVDLVVVATRVDTHFALAAPSVAAGKAVYVEWPLTHDVQSSRELAALGTRGMVGLQGRLAPVLVRIRKLLRGGELGKVLSSEVRAFGGTMDREMVAEGLSYFAERKVGGNVVMIGFAHSESLTGFLSDLMSRPWV